MTFKMDEWKLNGKQKFLTVLVSLNWDFFPAGNRKWIVGPTQLDLTISLLLAVICDYSVRTLLGGRIIPCILWLRKAGMHPSAPSLDGVGEADPARAPPASLHVDVLPTKNTTGCSTHDRHSSPRNTKPNKSGVLILLSKMVH